MENWYQGRVTETMRANYCWFLQRKSNAAYQHQAKRSRVIFSIKAYAMFSNMFRLSIALISVLKCFVVPQYID